jgi:GH24 family phage-related lysozyme (muramidase)
MEKLQALITYHEGRKNVIYKDTRGYLTGGIGHLITSPGYVVGQAITDEQIDSWFIADVQIAIDTAKKYLGEDAFNKLSDERQTCLIDMCFNMGPKINQFITLKASLLLGRYDLAANAMMNSAWYSQVGRRGSELITIMKSSVITIV